MFDLAMLWKAVSAVAIGLMAPTVRAAEPANRLHTLQGRAQGTTYSIKFWGKGDRGADVAAVQKGIGEALARSDREMSTYRHDSEISRFNQAPAGEWFNVSGETAAVVERALEFHRRTGGALDVTVGPLVRLWGFGAGADNDLSRTPTEQELQEAMANVGAHRLHVRSDPPALRKDAAGLEVDLSGIAPGYTVDVLVDLLRQFGYRSAMVELGGEVRAVGLRPNGQAWRIGVESPSTGAIAGVVSLREMALTTAGDSRQVREIGGVRYTHLVDPHSGTALPYREESVTVLAETALEADALDTALMVMGSPAGYDWCVEHQVAALFQSHELKTQGLEWRCTPRWLELLPKGMEAPQRTVAE